MKISTFFLGILLSFGLSGYTQEKNYDVINVPDSKNSDKTIPCDSEGSATVDSKSWQGKIAYATNPAKNRYDFPSKSSIKVMDINQLIATDAIKGKFDVGVPVQVTGYVYMVKPGEGESCNCGTLDESFTDTHIELTPSADQTDPQYRLIVEITPRMRQIKEAQGVDWSTETLKSQITNKTITVQGWLFYDEIHKGNSFATNPENKPNKKGVKPDWRAALYEVHPITDLVVEDATNATEQDPEDQESGSNNYQVQSLHSTILPSGPDNSFNSNNNNSKSTPMNQTSSPLNILVTIIIGAILGAVGQGIRVIVGMKKVYDDAQSQNTPAKSLMEYKQIAISLFIGFSIGAVAGVLAVVTSDNIQFSKATIIAFITAGYSGTDFIEGIVKKYPAIQGSKNNP